MSEITTGKLVIWLLLQAKRITPAGNRTSIMLSAAADRLEQQEQRIAELEQYLSRRVCYTKIDELERELAAAKEELASYKKAEPIFCWKCHRPIFANDKYCSHCGAREGEGK